MDKGDYSEVKELITTNSNSATYSPFDGDSGAFYSSAKDDSFQKGGYLRSFRKNGFTEGVNRHDMKGSSNNQRSEKDQSAWAMVHEVGHGLHFSEAAADIAFVTKNALALRDAHSNESKTAPFKSIQAPAIEKQTADVDSKAPKQPNGNMNTPGTRGNGNNNIFSYNSSRNVKAAAADAPEAAAAPEPYDEDSNCEKDSTASFDFNRHRSGANVVGPLTKPTPSKWDDAEKWLSAGETAPAKPRPKNSPLSAPARKLNDPYPNPEGEPALERTNGTDHVENGNFDGEENSPEKSNKFMSSKKSLLPRFAFMAGNGRPVPLPLPAVAPVDRYPLEDVFGRGDSNTKESSDLGLDLAFSKAASRTAKPTAGAPIEAVTKGAVDQGTDPEQSPSDAPVYADPPNMRTVCMRDMGTEMTPMASVDPSRTATPLMATTPNLGSPAISRPTSPGRVRNTTPTSTGSKEGSAKVSGPKVGGPKALEAVGRVSHGLSGKEKTRAEILALGTQLGKANIAAWATKEEEEADAAQALKASMEMEEVRKNLLASRAAAWEEAEQAKYTARFKREEAKIQAWENHEKAKAEAEMRRVEVKVERMRSHANEKLMNKLAAARRRAEDLRAKAEAVRCEQAATTASRSDYIRRTGKIPRSLFSQMCG
ncbi:hypothetical protein KC19_2G249900 [Ceratodon purpureus]|uniref:Remorin C-terminal domain-containing protein n=2 Tax=Ceratodon purpureus TaxID=3225 RepID=A0A8T0J085_CERPU|nr:hypothetical protein KC19_2G249900 [Ceratodon purpureus]